MSKVIKRVVVEMSFESDTEENLHIKEWWLKNHISAAVSSRLPHINDKISNVNVDCTDVTILPEEITISINEIL